MKTINADLENQIIGTMQGVWQYLGADALQLCQEVEGKDYATRDMVIELVTDAGRTEEKLKGEALAYYKTLDYKAVVKLAKKAFPLARYGM